MNSPRRRAKPLTFGGENRRIKLTALGEPGVTFESYAHVITNNP
jgi:hypothetical protein